MKEPTTLMMIIGAVIVAASVVGLTGPRSRHSRFMLFFLCMGLALVVTGAVIAMNRI